MRPHAPERGRRSHKPRRGTRASALGGPCWGQRGTARSTLSPTAVGSAAHEPQQGRLPQSGHHFRGAAAPSVKRRRQQAGHAGCSRGGAEGRKTPESRGRPFQLEVRTLAGRLAAPTLCQGECVGRREGCQLGGGRQSIHTNAEQLLPTLQHRAWFVTAQGSEDRRNWSARQTEWPLLAQDRGPGTVSPPGRQRPAQPGGPARRPTGRSLRTVVAHPRTNGCICHVGPAPRRCARNPRRNASGNGLPR